MTLMDAKGVLCVLRYAEAHGLEKHVFLSSGKDMYICSSQDYRGQMAIGGGILHCCLGRNFQNVSCKCHMDFGQYLIGLGATPMQQLVCNSSRGGAELEQAQGWSPEAVGLALLHHQECCYLGQVQVSISSSVNWAEELNWS